MNRLLLMFCIITVFIKSVYAQDTVKTNPIIFGEGFIGGPIAGLSGIYIGLNANYQLKNNLFSFRISTIPDFDSRIISPFIPFPYFIDNGHADEYSLLYGLRSIKNNHSFSFSVGASYNYRLINTYDDQDQLLTQNKYNYAGLPFELNVKWFKNNKSRYRIYYFFPVGKPTGFGRSFGLKLSGNISKYSYVAFGLVGGLGYHKHY
ncbi:MAG: hypothetical protein EOP43_01810 [Sphingobacteriaceae bacterium]|nr:MAG: hypothetical protein EOP43_01810 [Sphingobacteriaceae bacterium]